MVCMAEASGSETLSSRPQLATVRAPPAALNYCIYATRWHLPCAVCLMTTEPASDRQRQPASTCHHPPNLEAGEIGGDNVDLLGRVHDEAALARVEAGRVCPLALRNGVEGGQGWLVVGHSVFFLARWMGMVVVGVRVLRLTL